MKVLIIGANGFLGTHLVRKCLSLNWKVECIYNENEDNIPASCKTYHISELQNLGHAYQAIFLLAARIPYGKLSGFTHELIDNNVLLPLQISRQFPLTPIIYSSSVSVYGATKGVISENSTFTRPNAYGLSKLSGEYILQTHPRFRIIRFSSLYGKGMQQNTFLPKIIKTAKYNNKITLFGNGNRKQDYLHVDEAVEYCLEAAMYKENSIFLGVYGKSYSNLAIAKIIKRNIPECSLTFEGEDKSQSYMYNNEWTKKTLQFEPVYPLEEG